MIFPHRNPWISGSFLSFKATEMQRWMQQIRFIDRKHTAWPSWHVASVAALARVSMRQLRRAATFADDGSRGEVTELLLPVVSLPFCPVCWRLKASQSCRPQQVDCSRSDRLPFCHGCSFVCLHFFFFFCFISSLLPFRSFPELLPSPLLWVFITIISSTGNGCFHLSDDKRKDSRCVPPSLFPPFFFASFLLAVTDQRLGNTACGVETLSWMLWTNFWHQRRPVMRD